MNKPLPISLIVLLCLASLLSHHSLSQSKEMILEKTDAKDFKVLFYKGYSGNTNLELSADDLKSLTVNSGAGNVIVVGHNSNVINVEATVTLSATNPGRAVRIVKEYMSLSLKEKGDMAILTSYFDFHGRSHFKEGINPNGFFTSPVRKIDLVVKVPKHLALTVDDRSGDLKIEDIENDLSVHDRSGDLRIKNIRGNINLTDSSGDMEIININEGNGVGKTVRIVDNSGAISLNQLNGDLNIHDNSGDIHMRNIKGNVVLIDSSGGLVIDDIDGDLKLRDSSGDVKANDINGNFTLNDSSGGVYVNYVAKNVHVEDAGTGDLHINKYDGKISGDLRRLRK